MRATKLRLYSRIQIAARVLQKEADRRIGSMSGLTTSQAAVLAVINDGKDVTQRDVARALRMNESAVTAMIARLIKLGLVSREPSESDGRAWLLRLKPPARAAMNASRSSFEGINEKLEQALPAADRVRLSQYLDRILAVLEDEGSESDPPA